MDRRERQVWFVAAYLALCGRIPARLGIVLFIDGNSNMNNSSRLKRIYPSAGWIASRLSRGRKRIRFGNQWLAVNENWHPSNSQQHRHSELTDSFIGPFAKVRKATISFAMFLYLSVRPSVRMEELGSQWTDLYKMWYLRVFSNSGGKIWTSFKFD